MEHTVCSTPAKLTKILQDMRSCKLKNLQDLSSIYRTLSVYTENTCLHHSTAFCFITIFQCFYTSYLQVYNNVHYHVKHLIIINKSKVEVNHSSVHRSQSLANCNKKYFIFYHDKYNKPFSLRTDTQITFSLHFALSNVQ